MLFEISLYRNSSPPLAKTRLSCSPRPDWSLDHRRGNLECQL